MPKFQANYFGTDALELSEHIYRLPTAWASDSYILDVCPNYPN